MSLSFLLASILVLINLFAIGIFDRKKVLKLPSKKGSLKIVEKPAFPYFISFAGGLTLTYLFLDLFPRISYLAQKETPLILLLIVAGFFFFHLTEKYLYQHLPREEFKKSYRLFHLSILALYKCAEGIVLFELAQISNLEVFLFFIPLLFLSLNEDFSLHNWHGSKEILLKVIASTTLLLGVILASYVDFKPLIADLIIAFVAGALLYLSIITLAPKEKGGRLYALLGGSLTYILIFLYSISLK